MFKKQFEKILKSLGFVDKAKSQKLTEDEWKQIDAAFKKEYGKSMAELMDENDNHEELAQERQDALALLNTSVENENTNAAAEGENSEGEGNEDTENNSATDTNEQTSIVDGIRTIQTQLDVAQKENKSMREKIDKMAKTATPDNPMKIVTQKLRPSGPGHTENHLFGIEHGMFDMNDRWNKIAKNINEAKLSSPTKDDAKNFQNKTYEYGSTLAKRYKFLKDNNLLEGVKKDSTFANNITGLSDAGLGSQYMVMRQDALIARIANIPSMDEFFPVRSGVQDRELMTIAYFEELSQAYQPGHVFKGGMKLQPEIGYVDDAMFKAEFGPMKEIERQYIGYLNTNGSDPMKWSMIEWQLLNMYVVLVNEKNKRVARGCYVKPETGVAGSYLNAGTGLIYSLQRYYHESKLLPNSDELYNDYSKVGYYDAVKAFLSDVSDNLADDETLDDKVLYLNKRHREWWLACIRTKFGEQTDFTGVDSYANVVPDTDIRIKWLPNLGNIKLMMLQKPGNLQQLEFEPGEMLSVDFDKAMELMHVWSNWKEGFSGYIVGKAFGSLAELTANNYEGQEIFMNHHSTPLAADATTVDASKNFWFRSVENTAATTITDITNISPGVVYVIETGSETFPSKIAKSGRFANIAAWTPTKVGDYIMVILGSDNKFIELERRVAGTRTINVSAQPNIPGGRK